MNLERTILEKLGLVTPQMINERVLLAEVNLDSPTPILPSQLRSALLALETKRQILSIPNEDRGTQFQITDLGKARLLS